MISPINTHQRQIHLDFHTSPFIPDVGSEFDAGEFAQTLKNAHVNSVTVFAKCHHGMCYFPTTTGTPHPALQGRDLLGEQIEALHRAGIRAPIYTTVVWEEDAAARFPLWRQMRKDGTFAGTSMATDYSGPHPGAWKWMNFLNPEYQDYFEAHVREITDRYGKEVDGFFFDILMMHPTADWSESGIKFREKHGLMGEDDATFRRLEAEAQASFSERFSRQVAGVRPDATVFFNSATYLSADSGVGIRRRAPFQSHFEVESLPSGFWGYHHFGRLARMAANWRTNGENQPWLAMTGRFQKQWGDFGGIKPQPALEFECFRAQALGGSNSVGDQLPPRGILDPDAYALIGAVYAQCEAAEEFYEGSQALPQVGIICPFAPGLEQSATDKSEEGAVMMCEEAHYDAKMLDDASDTDEYAELELIIVPDNACLTSALVEKLRTFYQNGGKLIVSHRAVFNTEGQFLLDFLPLSFHGEAEKWPTFWRATQDFLPQAQGDRVFYQRGLCVRGEGLETLVQRVLPYFQRTDTHFCSHFQTPPQKDADEFAAVVAGERFVYFADPIFREYRQTGNVAARDGWKAAMQRLVGPAPFGEGLPTTVWSAPRRRGNDLLVTLLHYIPVRKALDIDIIEERMSFSGLNLKLRGAKNAQVFNGEALAANADEFSLPITSGRLLVEVKGYFDSE
jgi:hypothetical protein